MRSRAACADVGLQAPVLAKIERPEAVARAAAIVAAFDAIMVARGDLGVEIPLERVPTVQKTLIAEARAAGKPVVTATDMLDSMRAQSAADAGRSERCRQRHLRRHRRRDALGRDRDRRLSG